MADDIKRAMEALEREVCASLESDDHGINDPAVITFAQAQVVLAALREREQAIEQAYWRGSSEALVDTPWGSVDGVHKAIEQARKDEREAWERVLPQIRIDSGDVEVVDDDQGPFLSPQFIAKAMAAAIRARGAR